MNPCLKHLAPILVLSIVLCACGDSEKKEVKLSLSGRVVYQNKSARPDGPVFIAVLDRSPADGGSSFTDALVAVQAVDTGSLIFTVDLAGKNLKAGDSVYLVVFADNNYNGGIPSPDEGDMVGYYLDTETLSPALSLEEGGNAGIEIRLDREVFAYEASVGGTVKGEGEGSVTVFAYAGDISTLDIGGIDSSDILGYTQVSKSEGPVEYTLPILPYGRNVPIHYVYLMAFLDKNGNGRPDAGDRLGFHSTEDGLPALVTINQGHLPDCDITLSLTIPTPSGSTLSMEGTVDVADSLEPLDKNLFILVVRAADNLDLDTLIGGDLSSVTYFSKLPKGERHFSFDLSKSGLAAGDKVMVLALYDKGYAAGFPKMDEGDLVGYYQDRTAMAVDLILAEGLNRIGVSDGTDFRLGRVLVNHDASLTFRLDDSNLRNSLNVSLDPNEHVTVVAVHKDGVHINQDPVIDMDYIIGFGSCHVPSTGNSGHEYSLSLLPAMDCRIPVQNPFAVEGVYVFAIFDGNLDDGPEKNNYVGYYWRTFLLFYMAPREITRLSDGVTVLDQTVRFTTDTL